MVATKEKLPIEGGAPAVQYRLPSVNDISGRSLGQEEIKEIAEVIASGNMGFISGTKIKILQEKFRQAYEMEAAICVSSGTAALHTAFNFLDIGPGDEVLVLAITDIGTILGVMLQGANPVFVDVDPVTQNMDPDDIERHITARTKAVIPVHLYGFPCDMDKIIPIAHQRNLYVIENCAQAIFTRYKGKLVGTFGDLACISLQQSKHIRASGLIMGAISGRESSARTEPTISVTTGRGKDCRPQDIFGMYASFTNSPTMLVRGMVVLLKTHGVEAE